ncbi:MAG: glycosyltransferase family 9 protein [Gammaproteobacteria bacterium]|nr:MAG: glycosyltransferase family 9 protein [Gammaproteobacteria bacterium]
MSSRTAARLAQLPWWLRNSLKFKRPPGDAPSRILVCHHLLLGDTLMLAPLIAALRARFPQAHIAMTVDPAMATLFSHRPLGLHALPFDPRAPDSVRTLLRQQGWDLALIPGDNRYSWLALAMGARWIRAFSGDRPAYKSWPVSEALSYPNTPEAWPDMNLRLIGGSLPAVKWQPGLWIPEAHKPDAAPEGPYAVLHLGASSPTKFWPAENWRALANTLADRGLNVVLTTGPGEGALANSVDPDRRHAQITGTLKLSEMARLLAHARLVVSPDTGILHLARLSGTPTVGLFGPGSAPLYTDSRYFDPVPFRALQKPIACRNQSTLFKRNLPWVQRCSRPLDACPPQRCMALISVADVLAAIEELVDHDRK